MSQSLAVLARALWLASICCVVLISPCSLRAQTGTSPRQYVKIPVQGDFEELLKGMLNQVQEGQQFKNEFKKLLEKSGNDPSKLLSQFKLNPDQLNKLKDQLKNNPIVQQQIKDYFNPENLKKLPLDQKQRQALQDVLKKMQPPKIDPPDIERPKITQPITNPTDVNGNPLNPNGNQPTTPQPEPGDYPFNDVMKEIAKSDIGEFLKESDAFQDVLKDFSNIMADNTKFLQNEKNPLVTWLAETEAPDWSAMLPAFDNWPLADIEPPSLPNIDISMPNFGGGPSAPAFGAPSGAGVAPFLLVVFLFVVGGFLLWFLLKATPWSPLNPARQRQRELGPWPVDPAKIRTPGELILAFNYLSLLLLGLQARSWNHKEAAEGIGPSDRPQRSQDAADLAALYENARYAPAQEPLTEAVVQNARRCVSTLARR